MRATQILLSVLENVGRCREITRMTHFAILILEGYFGAYYQTAQSMLVNEVLYFVTHPAKSIPPLMLQPSRPLAAC